MKTDTKQREYAFYLSFSSFIGTFFFLGIYLELLRTLWLSLLVGALIVWLFLTLLIHRSTSPVISSNSVSAVQRLLALAAIAYGGFALCGFFFFCQQCIFPQQGFWFFPVCFIAITGIGAFSQIHTLERTAKFTSAAVWILLLLTMISMVQKLWSEKDFIRKTWSDLFAFETAPFLRETAIVTVILFLQALVLITVLECSNDRTAFLRSIRRALLPSVLLSSLLHLISVLALGAVSFEHLTWPIYDMLSLPGYADYLDRTELLMLLISLFCESVKSIVFFRAGRGLFARQSRG
ncbi:MAG: hypothetical protein IJN41_05430 [Firmicutes bacterium]|nr:hypothetical protein [Bacillota bacterium]